MNENASVPLPESGFNIDAGSKPDPAIVSTANGESPGIIAVIGALPSGAFITEVGLADILDKCTASIKAAVERGELPRPVRLMGKNTWTAGAIVRHHETRLENEARKFTRLRP